MPAFNQYPAPQLPLSGNEQFMIAQMQNGHSVTCTTTIANVWADSDSVDIGDLGAIGDGASHPLSGVTSFNGINTSGWLLAQWQKIFPFATALTNELDSCVLWAASLQAIASGKPVLAPAGTFLLNMSITLNLAAGQTFNLFGAGMSATAFAVKGNITAVSIATTDTPSPGQWLSFADFTTYQSSTTVGGTFLSISGSTGSDATNGQPPTFSIRDVSFGVARGGQNQTAFGVFSPAVSQYCGWTGRLTNCKFIGIYSTTLGGANGRNGIGFQNNGASPSILSFGPYVTACEFDNLDIGVLIGDGTNAHVQGVKFANCTWVAVNTGVKWHSSIINSGNDLLQLVGCDIQSYVNGIDVNSGPTVILSGNYFLGSSGTQVSIVNSENSAQIIEITGNQFTGFGQQVIGLYISGTTNNGGLGSYQVSINVSGNAFFDFGNTEAVPLILDSKVHGALITSNEFCDSNVPQDNSTSNLNGWTNNMWFRSDSGNRTLYAEGVPAGSSNILSTNLFMGGISSGLATGDSGQSRLMGQTYGVILRNDDSQFYVLLTPENQPWANFNSLRPFAINVATGAVSIDASGAGTTIGGPVILVAATETPVSGATVNVSETASLIVVEPAGALAALTINMPAVSGTLTATYVFEIVFLQAVAALTWISTQGFSGAALPSSVTAGQSVTLKFLPTLNRFIHTVPV